MNNADLMNASMDDIVFEGRNKAYGSYVMRKLYNKRLLIGTIGGVILFLFICFLPVIAGVLSNMLSKEDKEMDLTEVILDQPPPIDPNEPPPPPPPPPVEPPPPVAQIRFVPPVVKEDEEVKEEEPPPTEEELKEEKAISNVDAEGEKATNFDVDAAPAPPPPPPPEEKPEPEQALELFAVEQQPEFPDGTAALYKWLGQNIKYPAIARENGIEGQVVLSFVVEKDGSITDIKPLRELGGGCTDEAIRVVKMMPKWRPGKQNGRAVKVKYTLPVKFKLE
jgi:protein TonB